MKKEVNYKVTGEEWQEALDKEYNKIKNKVRVPGFRPGKVSRDMYEKHFGVRDIALDAADALIDKEFRRLLDEEKIEPIIRPDIKLVNVDHDGLEVNFIFVLEPEVKLGEYKNLGIKEDDVKVTDEDIQRQIDSIISNYAELMPKDGAIEDGDVAVIDYEGFKDGVAFDGGKAENYSLKIGSHTFIPGFEEGLIGMKNDEEKDLELTFPEDYHSEELKGAKVVFKVKVHDIKSRVLPELNEEFFKDLDVPGVTSKEELENKVREELTKDGKHKAYDKYVKEVLEKATSNMEVEIDDEIVQAELDDTYNKLIQNLKEQNINEETYLKFINKTKEEFLDSMRDDALRRIKNKFLVDAVIKKEKIEVTEEEIDARIKELAEEYNVTEEDILSEMDRETIGSDLKVKKVIDIMGGKN